jgi:hypothetical protein
LNIAFDKKREYLYLSLIASLVGLGLNPRCVVEIAIDASRLDRLHDLIRSCQYSIHDLSAVEVTSRPYRVPRFNMPFELGLAVAVKLQGDHEFRLLEAVRHRLDQSLSDLKGYDPYVHGGTPTGVFDAVRDMFAGVKTAHLSRRDFCFVYDTLRRFRRTEAGRGDPFRAALFGELVMTARGAKERLANPSVTPPSET